MRAAVSLCAVALTRAAGAGRAVYRVKRQKDGKVYAMKQINTQKMTQKEREDAVNEVRSATLTPRRSCARRSAPARPHAPAPRLRWRRNG